MEEFRLADDVWARVVQAVQEAFLTGTDVSDILRQVRVVVDEKDPTALTLSPSYREQVKAMHKALLERAKELEAQQVGNKYIVPGTADNGSEPN